MKWIKKTCSLDISCVPTLLCTTSRFLGILERCYQQCRGRDLFTLAMLKRYAGEAVQAAANSALPYHHQEQLLLLSHLPHLSVALAKALQEEAACLRRVRRLGPWDGTGGAPDGKVLLMSGKIPTPSKQI